MGGGVSGGMGGVPTCTHMHAHAHTHVHMYRNCKWLPTWRHPCLTCLTHGWVCGWMGGSVGQWVGLGQSTKNLINLDIIEIIQFCLKIYDL